MTAACFLSCSIAFGLGAGWSDIVRSESQVNSSGAVLTIQALIGGTSELHITRSGIYWKHLTNSKLGRNNGQKAPTRINGADWQPQWNKPGDDGKGKSEVYRIQLSSLDLPGRG